MLDAPAPTRQATELKPMDPPSKWPVQTMTANAADPARQRTREVEQVQAVRIDEKVRREDARKAVLDALDYRKWLLTQDIEKSTRDNQISRVRRLERVFGDLDAAYAADAWRAW